MPFTFEQVFLSALIFYFLVHFFTCTAEISHLKRTMFKVPEPLEKKIPLAQHIKAHRYDIARTKLNLVEVTITTLVILALTKFHGIDYLSELLMDQVGDQFAFHWMLPALIAFIFLIVDLPFTWQKEFRLREAYGYTRESQSQWFSQLALTSIIGWFSILPILWVGLWFWRQSGAEWWIIGWILFSIYLIFPLHLAQRLRYFFKPSMASEVTNPELVERFKEMGNRAGIGIKEIRVTRAEHDDDLPPAFAFGHRKGVRIFIRHNVLKQLSDDNLMAIGAHALARNLSHMYFQAWLVCSLVGLFVFMFLAWLAPQSWFLDEIGFKAIGPGPYYGSLISFAMVALPVLLFPFKLPMDAFLRHLIFRSDLFALRYAGLSSISNALIELTPSPMRHSCITLEFFDLLFSHEPSIMARLSRVKHNYQVMKGYHTNEDHLSSHLELRQHVENVERALQAYNAQQRLIESEQQDFLEQQAARKKEAELVAKAEAERDSVTQPLGIFKDKEIDQVSQRDNSLHRTYGMGLLRGFFDLLSQCLKVATHQKAQSCPNLSPTSDPQDKTDVLSNRVENVELEDTLVNKSTEVPLDETKEFTSKDVIEPISLQQSDETPVKDIEVTTIQSTSTSLDDRTTLSDSEATNVPQDSCDSSITLNAGNAENNATPIDTNEIQNISVQYGESIKQSDTNAPVEFVAQEPLVSTASAMEIEEVVVADIEQKDTPTLDLNSEEIAEHSNNSHFNSESLVLDEGAVTAITEVTHSAQESIPDEMSDKEKSPVIAQSSDTVASSVTVESDAMKHISPDVFPVIDAQGAADSIAETISLETKEDLSANASMVSAEENADVKPKRKRTTRSKTSSTSEENSSTEVSEKPKRTRTKTTTGVRKRTKKTDAVDLTKTSEEMANDTVTSSEVTEDQSAPAKKTRSATKSTTRRATRKKVEEAASDSTQQNDATDLASTPTEVVENSAEVTVKPKRTRSTTTRKTSSTKTSRKKAEEVKQDVDNSVNAPAEVGMEVVEETATKPKRARSTSKTTTRKTSSTKTSRKKTEEVKQEADTSVIAPTEIEKEAVEETATKPKRSRSTAKTTTRKTPVRKSTRKKAEETTDNDPQVTKISDVTAVGGDLGEVTSDVPSKPKRTRATTKNKTVTEPAIDLSEVKNEQAQ